MHGGSNHQKLVKWPTHDTRSLKLNVDKLNVDKLNVDASVFNGATSYSIGMVLRNEHGEFTRGKNMHVAGIVYVALKFVRKQTNKGGLLLAKILYPLNSCNMFMSFSNILLVTIMSNFIYT